MSDGIRTRDLLSHSQVLKSRNPTIPQEITETTESVLASCLAFIRENRPNLAAVIDAWQHLPVAVRTGILAMVRASDAERDE